MTLHPAGTSSGSLICCIHVYLSFWSESIYCSGWRVLDCTRYLLPRAARRVRPLDAARDPDLQIGIPFLLCVLRFSRLIYKQQIDLSFKPIFISSEEWSWNLYPSPPSTSEPNGNAIYVGTLGGVTRGY